MSNEGRTTSRAATGATGSAKGGAAAGQQQQQGFEGMLEKLSPKDRQNVEKHMTAHTDAGQHAHADLWKRLASTMASLTPLPPKATAQRTVQFFIPDGKWRMQVFALEDRKEGTIAVYIEDVLSEAVKAGILTKAKPAAKGAAAATPGLMEYTVKGTDTTLAVEQLDGKTESDPAPFYKDMLGWNRRALRITLPPGTPEPATKAVERICELATLRRGAKGG